MVVPPQKTPRMPASQRLVFSPSASSSLGVVNKPADFAMLENGGGLLHNVLHVSARRLELLVGQMTRLTQRGSRSMK